MQSMPRKTLAIIICLFFILTSLFAIVFSETPRTPEVTQSAKKIKPIPTPVAQTVISLFPDTVDLVAKETADVAVTMDTGENEIVAIQIVIGYDPLLLRAIDLRPAGIMQESREILKDINAKNGRLSYALSLTPTQKPIIAHGDTIAIVTFARNQFFPASINTQTSEITLLQRSLASARGVGPSVIKNLFGTKVILPAASTTYQPQ